MFSGESLSLSRALISALCSEAHILIIIEVTFDTGNMEWCLVTIISAVEGH